VKYFDNSKILQIMLENKDGSAVNVEQCAMFSRLISPKLDIEDIISDNYNLEVSSTGIDRPLTKLKDFVRFIGSDIVFKPNNDKKRKGKIKEVVGNNIKILSESDIIDIDIDNILFAKLDV